MGRRPKRPCAHSSCSALVERGYCDRHKKIEEDRIRQNNRHYDRYVRDREATEFYKSRAWDRLRVQALMRDHYLCRRCLDELRITPAVIVDHRVPIKEDWSLRLELSNLQSLCRACHNHKTAEDLLRARG